MKEKDNQPTAGRLQPHSEDATPDDPFVCERCGDPLGCGTRFCSRACFEDSVADGTFAPLPSMTFEEMQAEMRGVFERLASYPEEETP